MRVLQLGPLYNNHLRRWSANAVAAGAEVHAAGHVRAGRRPTDLGGVVESVAFLPPELNDADPAAQLGWLGGVLDRVRPDVVQAHWLPRWGYLAVRSGHPAVLATPWGSDVYEATGEARQRAGTALREAAGVIARSPHMEGELLARGAPPDRLHRVDLGVDLERFSPASDEEARRLREELDLPDGPVVLSFRAGTELYNLDVVIRAFGLLRARSPGVSLVLAHGDAPLAPAVREALESAEGVRDLGHVPHAEMPALFRAASVGISIPGSDGSPSSVWEALACGLPLVLSALPQVSARLGPDAGARFVVPDAAEVADALADALERRAELGRAARAWAEANAGAEPQVRRLAAAYAAVASAPATASAADGGPTTRP